MTKYYLKDTLGWGLGLWLMGYVLGIILFMFVPPQLIGWVIMPVGAVVTLLILFKKINSKNFTYYVTVAIVWTLIAVLFDYLFIVKLLKPADGYYKLDVYLYYVLTFTLPILAGWYKKSQ